MHGRQCPGALRCYYSVPRLLIRNARFLPRDAMLARYLLCQSVRPLQAGIVSKRLDESRWFLAWRLPPAYPTPCCKEIWMSPEICVLPPRNFLPNSGLKTVSPRQVDRVVNKTRRRRRRRSSLELVDDTYTTVDESWLVITRRSTATLQLHYCDLLWIFLWIG